MHTDFSRNKQMHLYLSNYKVLECKQAPFLKIKSKSFLLSICQDGSQVLLPNEHWNLILQPRIVYAHTQR